MTVVTRLGFWFVEGEHGKQAGSGAEDFWESFLLEGRLTLQDEPPALGAGHAQGLTGKKCKKKFTIPSGEM